MIHGRDRGSRLTRFEVYSRIAERTGKTLEILQPPTLPDEIEYLWFIYLEIRKGCERIHYTDLDAYSRIMGIEFAPWEALLLLDIDLIRCHDNG